MFITTAPGTHGTLNYTHIRFSTPGGKVTHVIEYGIDITERRRAEEERLRLVTPIEQSVETVMITDNHGVIEYVNPAFEKISGYARGEVIGRNPRSLKGPLLLTVIIATGTIEMLDQRDPRVLHSITRQGGCHDHD